MPRYSRYSHHARRALTHAGLLTQRFRHPRVSTGHLLVGVMLAEGSIGHSVLDGLNLNIQDAQKQLEALVIPVDDPPETPPNDAALDIALDLAGDESTWLGHHYIGTEHLLLGMTRTNIGNASDLLHALDVAPEAVRHRVRQLLSDGHTEYSLEQVRRDVSLTELARRVINAAELVAIALDHPHIGLGHLLLVLLRERRSPICRVLRESALDERQIQQTLTVYPATVAIDRVIIQAMEYAQSLGSHYTGTEHLILALLTDADGMALVRQYNVDPEKLLETVGEQLGKRR